MSIPLRKLSSLAVLTLVSMTVAEGTASVEVPIGTESGSHYTLTHHGMLLDVDTDTMEIAAMAAPPQPSEFTYPGHHGFKYLSVGRRFPSNGIHYWIPLSLDQCPDASPVEEPPVLVHPDSNVQLCPNVNLHQRKSVLRASSSLEYRIWVSVAFSREDSSVTDTKYCDRINPISVAVGSQSCVAV
ncbi:hypothetical protein BU23DRAFT_571146 [Bimuria novae-zelandiae CBS 107.79]|uniref:Ubiquitin 3 binding protein But2 C-terminal domain-containing protein n=1 Tax=Bimuria novae-zelandiae CBS 107.79 TaxID=1447943 RepID=A0A6A5V1A9_9PLEO|nr:hypothetical protein BU23DRAFT_571146 [Bimuria novae-zelandiae CBS 107.79]